MNQSAAYYLYNIAQNTNNIYNKAQDIYNALFYGNHNISYWVNSISTWMSPIFNAISNIPVDLTSIDNGLWRPLSNGSRSAYLSELDKALSNYYFSYGTGLISFNEILENGHASLLPYDSASEKYSLLYTVPIIDYYGNIISPQTSWAFGTPIGNVAFMLSQFLTSFANESHFRNAADLTDYNISQSYIDPISLNTSSFSPTSAIDGIYKWLSKIQTPAARLAYVLASDERIEAQEAAAANEEAVVDNFIDSTGDGAASPSDIGSVSGLSSGYKQNFATDASPSGIFDIFNSDHATWFSQETKNQLDTTTPSRLSKSFASETPLLDKQIEDIYDALGVKQP